MVDRKALKKSFKSAVQSSNPYALAQLLQSLPNVADASSKQSQEPQPATEQSLQLDGIDWTGVLTSFMNAWEAAEAVSESLMVQANTWHVACAIIRH
jgi:hypothetical protein